MPIGKYLKTPEDFVVEEIIDTKFLKKFSRTSEGVERTKGKYFLCLLKKRNMTTEQALKTIAKKLGIPKKDIGYAGLKDKFAVTTQYITTPLCHEFEEKNISIKKIGITDKKIGIGDLVGNKFTITFHDFNKKFNHSKDFLIPNYFGDQRFGANKDNHIIGKKILQRKYDTKELTKDQIKFFIHAYQSHIFNKTLQKMKKNKHINRKADLIGFNSKARNDFSKLSLRLMKRDDITQKDFEFKDLKLKCVGSERPLFAEVSNFSCKKEQNRTILEFTLQKGSYGTVVVEFLIKTNKVPNHRT
jgi:tRNA(Glu) U13 pseudouridine synthase TruD